MRVSTAVNAIAAPMLYRNVVWQSGHPLPFSQKSRSSMYAKRGPHRQTSTKEENLDRIQVLSTELFHARCECPIPNCRGGAWSSRIPVTVLRELDTDAGYWSAYCSTLGRIHPRKVVTAAKRFWKRIYEEPWRYSLTVETVIYLWEAENRSLRTWTHADSSDLPLSRRTARKREHKTESEIVLVIISANAYDIHMIEDWISFLYTRVRGRYWVHQRRPPTLDKLTVVNIEAFDEWATPEVGGGDLRVALAIMAEAEANKMYKMAFDFITKQEYLDKYDWTGEFTKEEAEEWLKA
jgi:hypothetical protein